MRPLDSQTVNPYEAPQASMDVGRGGAAPGGDLRTAGRSARFVAKLIDNLIVGVPAALFFMLGAVSGSEGELGTYFVLAGIGAFYALVVTIYQWLRLARTGQTIGKGLMKVKVVRLGGERVDFGSAVGMRLLLPGVLGIVPGFALVDALLIFRDDRRCAHDLMAGTRVVEARSDGMTG